MNRRREDITTAACERYEREIVKREHKRNLWERKRKRGWNNNDIHIVVMSIGHTSVHLLVWTETQWAVNLKTLITNNTQDYL